MEIGKVVSERAAWVGPDIQDSNEWLLHLNKEELIEIDIALNKLLSLIHI